MSAKSKEAKIVYGRVGSVTIYEITENELNLFETGSPKLSSINLAIFFLTLALSLLIALITNNIESQNIKIVFLSIIISSFVLGAFFLINWYRTSKSITNVIKEIKERAPRSSLMEEIIETEPEETLIFIDNFDTDEGWEKYQKGIVSLSKEHVRTGECSLKKDQHSEPNGGYKIISKVEMDIILEGWIYRPSNFKGGQADRLAIEGDDFNGYGFFIGHKSHTFGIERRDGGRAKTLVTGQHKLPIDNWYKFEFKLKNGGSFDLFLYDHLERMIIGIVDAKDNKYNSFDKVSIHGGFEYYVDQLKLQHLS